MDNIHILLLFLFLYYFLGSLIVSILVSRSVQFETFQKPIIVLLTFVIPIVGQLFVFRLLKEELIDDFKDNKVKQGKLFRFKFGLISMLFLSSDLTSTGSGGFDSSSNSSDSSDLD